jgi:multisubunit Na+/H+ antiporter MnhE subunit
VLNLETRGSALLAIVILPIVVVCRWRRMKVEEVVSAFVLAGLTWQMYRFSTFLGFALIPLAYRAFAPASGTTPPPPLMRRWRLLVAVAFAIAIGISVTRFTVAEISAPKRTPIDPQMDYFPFEACARMKEVVPPGTIFSDFFWGGVAVRAGYPNWKVSHDGRYYHFSQDEWDWYWAAMMQCQVGSQTATLADIVEKYHPVAFLLRIGAGDELIAKLDAPTSGWRRVVDSSGRDIFDRGQAVVFVPR